MIAAAAIITLLYILAMFFLHYGFSKVPNSCGKNLAPKTTFSIVIPFRNEAENLPHLLNSLLKLKYPAENFEVLLINDASTDASDALCKEFLQKHSHMDIQMLENLRKSGSPKKDAIQTGIEVAGKKYIITTDADCVVPTSWLQEFNAIISDQKADAVAGPVMLKTEVSKMSFLEGFQELDILSLQSATIGSFGIGYPFMCNGANFCYSKKAFLEVEGYEGNKEIASGDDVFLLEKFQKQGLKIAFLRSYEAIVSTNPVPNLPSLISQRTRWAAKTSATNNTFGKGLGLLVFLMNFSLSPAFIASVTGIFPYVVLLIIFLLKFNIDFLLIYKSAKFFRKENSLKSYFWSSLIYPFFSSYIVFRSIFSGYEWKGRRFKK